MIVTHEQWRWIAQRRKTAHWVPPHRAARTRVDATVPVIVERPRTPEEAFGFTSRVVTGGVRTAPPTVREERGRVVITAKRTVRLHDITHEDARRAGFRTTDEAIGAWIGFDPDRHPRRAAGVLAWIDTAASLLDREVTILEFEPDTKDHPLLLAPAGRPDTWGHTGGEERGYTERPGRALRGEPEAVDVELLDPSWRARAVERHRAAKRTREIARELRSLARRAGAARGPDAAAELERVAAELDALRRELQAIRESTTDDERRRAA